MPLDPQCAAVLKMFSDMGMEQAYKLPLDEFRASSRQVGVDPSIERASLAGVEDENIPGPAGTIRIRIYRAHEAMAGKAPLLLFFHGGGFVTGDLYTHDGLCCQITRLSGCVTVAVDYRLAPEHPFPSAVDDAEAALRWAVSQAPTLGIDPARIVVCGDSAGGDLHRRI